MFFDLKKIDSIYLYIEHVDFRKGIYGLCSCVGYEFANEENDKNLFVFTNRSRNKIRILYWDDTGYALWHKALDKKTFTWPIRGDSEIVVSPSQLKSLLAGLSIEAHKKSLPKRFF